MTKEELLKQKIEGLKAQKQKLAQSAAIIDSMTNLKSTLKEMAKESVETNKLSLFEHILTNATKNIANNKDVLTALEKQTEALQDVSGLEIARELKKLVAGVTKLENKTYFDEEKFESIFNKSLTKILNLVTSQQETPQETIYKRDNGRITKVTEVYNKFTLTHTWTYNLDGELVRVKTSKSK